MFSFIPDKEFFAKLVFFESKNNPLAANPRSSAKGLIQFIDSTARDLGYKDSADLVAKNPTFETQMNGPVKSYMEKLAPFRDKYDIAMAVFYPTYRKVPPDKLFPANVRKANPGINTPRDYVEYIEGHALKNGSFLVPFSLVLLLIRLLK